MILRDNSLFSRLTSAMFQGSDTHLARLAITLGQPTPSWQ